MPNLDFKYITDENGNRVLPITHVNAVRDSSGNTLPSLMAPEKNGSGIGTCSTSSSTALTVSLTGYELVTNGFVAVTFSNDVPANATLNVNNKGAKPIYYKGSAITADTIKANDTVTFSYDGTNYVVTSLGGGGGTIVWPEFVTISLTQSGGSDSDLIGATIVVTDDDTSETLLSTTWQGSLIAVQVDAGVDYTVTVGNITDYFIRTNTYSHTAVSGVTNIVTFGYISGVVDLGLPSGLLWSTKNVGATSELEIGYYFSYGNIDGHCLNGVRLDFNYETYDYSVTPGGELTASYSSGDRNYDAATYHMGDSYRTPTEAECTELLNNTDKEYVTNFGNSGVNGYKFMKKTDHSVYMFIPCCGWITNGFNQKTTMVATWSSTYKSSVSSAGITGTSSGIGIVVGDTRKYGMEIRPVIANN